MRAGFHLPDWRISCDQWKRSESPGTLYFLSHAHSDHLSGLGKSFDRPIYTSEETATLLPLLIPSLRASLIRPLPRNEPVRIPFPSGPPGELEVSLLDAAHCYGAVMFLFKSAKGRLLYTGDFRYEPDDPVFSTPPFISLFEGPPLDMVYADNTYLHSPRVQRLPSRAELTESIVRTVQEFCSARPSGRVVLASYKVGREALLQRLATKTQERLWAEPERAAILRAAGFPESLLSRSQESSRLYNLHYKALPKKLPPLAKSSEVILVILPTALHLSLDSESIHPAFRWTLRQPPNVLIHFFPFSDHSSGEEVEAFLHRLPMLRLFPIAHKMELEQTIPFLNKPEKSSPPTSPQPSRREVALKPCRVEVERLTAAEMERVLFPSNSIEGIAKKEIERKLGPPRTPKRPRRLLHDPRQFMEDENWEECVILSLPSPHSIARPISPVLQGTHVRSSSSPSPNAESPGTENASRSLDGSEAKSQPPPSSCENGRDSASASVSNSSSFFSLLEEAGIPLINL